MAKKKSTQQRPAGNQPLKVPASAPKQQPRAAAVEHAPGNMFSGKSAQWLIAGAIAIITFLFFKVCLNDKLTNWDDLGYIITDPLIKDSSAEGIRNIFKVSNPVMGNYHPLTILLYAIEYSYVGLEPWLYHFDSVLLHVLVTLAVYLFTNVLTRRPLAAAVTALLFGLHPMHVESVAWVAGRKDLLYGLFYVLSCTAYLYYVRTTGNKKWVWYAIVLVLFALSLLSKSVGVTLPVVLLLLDYFEQRKFDVYVLVEKIPHFALAALFGVISIKTQEQIGALGTLDVHFTQIERLALGGYALFTYIWKAIIPVGLSNFYPYPIKSASDGLPAFYYIYLLVGIGMMAAIWWLFTRKKRMVVFGLAFFLVNLLLLIQIIPVGGAIVSDRYSYIPYLGLFLILGWYVSNYFETKEKQQTGYAILAGVVVYSLILGYMSNERCQVWYDSVSLWKDDIEKHPESPVAYFYLGQEYYDRFESAKTQEEQKAYGDSAYTFFSKSIEHKPDYLNPIVCLAELQRSTGQIDLAKSNYEKARKINDKNASVYLGLAVIYSIQRQYDSAAFCFKQAVSLKTYFPEAHSNYANYFEIIGKEDSSLNEYAIAIAQNRDAYIPYMNRGKIYIKEKKWDNAIQDYNRAIEIKPEMGEPYYQRGFCYAQKGNMAQAKQDVQQSISLGYKQGDPAFYQQMK